MLDQATRDSIKQRAAEIARSRRGSDAERTVRLLEVSPAGPAQAAVARRLPGKARPRQEALREYEDFNRERRVNMPPVLWSFLAPDADQFYRWRVQLDCGCIEEKLTSNNEVERLLTGSSADRLCHRWLPDGQLLCGGDHDDGPAPYRDIAEWWDFEEHTFPPDPEEVPDWLADIPDAAEYWAKTRWVEPHTALSWSVTLVCGHADQVSTGTDWRPAHGPRRTSEKRAQEMTAEFEEMWAAEGEPTDEAERLERVHMRRILAERWPRPRPENLCRICPKVRFIVAYQRVGWLVPRPRSRPNPQASLPARPSRAALEAQLRKAEGEAARLRDELARHEET